MKKALALTAALTALFAGRVSAADVNDPRYFAVDEDSIMIQEVNDRGGTIPGTPVIPSPGELPKPPTNPQVGNTGNTGGDNPGVNGTAADPNEQFNNTINQINQTVGTLDNIVNLAEKIWNIIEKNQPVVNITTNYANAVPYGMSHWTQLQGWNKPATKKYSFSMKNGFGSQVVKVTYQVHYTYKGNFNGKGQFLTGVTVEPLNVETAWGYKVTLVSEVPDSTVANVGTSDDPIAAMQVQLKWTVHTAIKDITSKAIYYVRGDGQLEEIGTPFEKAAEAKTKARVDAASSSITGSTFD